MNYYRNSNEIDNDMSCCIVWKAIILLIKAINGKRTERSKQINTF